MDTDISVPTHQKHINEKNIQNGEKDDEVGDKIRSPEEKSRNNILVLNDISPNHVINSDSNVCSILNTKIAKMLCDILLLHDQYFNNINYINTPSTIIQKFFQLQNWSVELLKLYAQQKPTSTIQELLSLWTNQQCINSEVITSADSEPVKMVIVPQYYVQSVPIKNILYVLVQPKNYFDALQYPAFHLPSQIQLQVRMLDKNYTGIVVEGRMYNDILHRCQELDIYPDIQVYERLQNTINTTFYINGKSSYEIQQPQMVHQQKLPINFLGTTIYELDPYIYILRKHMYTYVGQANDGNTCYQNVVLQTLLHIPQLLCILLHPTLRISSSVRIQEHKVEFIRQQIQFIIDCSTIPLTASVLPSTLHTLFCYIYSNFNNRGQHDAQEAQNCIFDILLEVLDIGVSGYTTTIHNDNKNSTLNTLHNPLRNLQNGELRSSIICSSCECTSTRTETFYSLGQEVPIDSKKTSKKNNGNCGGQKHQENLWTSVYTTVVKEFLNRSLTLQDCLASYFAVEYFCDKNLYNCARCTRKVMAKQITKISKLPNLLIFYLKRFKVNFFGSSVKATREVVFPLQGLDMSLYTCIEDTAPSIYDQQAVIHHSGTVSHGHYTVTCLNSVTKEWYHYNDDVITILQPSQVQKQEAYVLVYNRIQDTESIYRVYKLYREVQIRPNEQRMLEILEYLLQRTKYNIQLVKEQLNPQYCSKDIIHWVSTQDGAIQLEDIEKYQYVHQSRSWQHSQRIQPCVIPIDNRDQQCIHGKYQILPLCGNVYSIPISYQGYKRLVDQVGGGPQVPLCPPQKTIAGVRTVELQATNCEVVTESDVQVIVQDLLNRKYHQEDSRQQQQVMESLQEIITDNKVGYLKQQMNRYMCFECYKDRYTIEFNTYKKLLRCTEMSDTSLMYVVSRDWVKKQLHWWNQQLQNSISPASYYNSDDAVHTQQDEIESLSMYIQHPGEVNSTEVQDLDCVIPTQMQAILYLFGGKLTICRNYC